MQSVFREIERALTDGRQYSALWYLMVGVWKRKPALSINEPAAGPLSSFALRPRESCRSPERR
jgi:hypothetical protein